MCEGPGAAMLRGEILNMVFPAFAALGHGQGSRELHNYKAWVHKLATKEYADELVVLATAHELNVEITCVPFTPYNSPRPWTISKYAPLLPAACSFHVFFWGTTTSTSCGSHQ